MGAAYYHRTLPGTDQRQQPRPHRVQVLNEVEQDSCARCIAGRHTNFGRRGHAATSLPQVKVPTLTPRALTKPDHVG